MTQNEELDKMYLVFKDFSVTLLQILLKSVAPPLNFGTPYRASPFSRPQISQPPLIEIL